MMREKSYENKQKTFVTDSNATKAKDDYIYCELIQRNNIILNNYKCKYSF